MTDLALDNNKRNIFKDYSCTCVLAILLLWQNRPAVVIGRHQNVWSEVNVDVARKSQVPVVRRKSGGGTVFHDLGNLNISFLSTKKKYDRKPNLALVANVLRKNWQLHVDVTPRDDIILNEKYKVLILLNSIKQHINTLLKLLKLVCKGRNIRCLQVSGTAAKLGVKSAYHHFTLLVDVSKELLHNLLKSDVVSDCRFTSIFMSVQH